MQVKILTCSDKKTSLKTWVNLMVMTVGHFCSQKQCSMPQIWEKSMGEIQIIWKYRLSNARLLGVCSISQLYITKV